MNRHRKNWTAEEVEYLEDQWGVISYKTIAKKLGRTVNSVKIKATRLNLGDPRKCFNGLTLLQLSEVIGVNYNALNHWVKVYDLPVVNKRLASKKSVMFIKIEDFWKWAEKNKEMIDFSRFEKNMLGAEEEWVGVKRSADQAKRLYVDKSNKNPWSEEEDRMLRSMVNAHSFTYPEIAQRLKRSQGAVKRRLLDLDMKARPVRLNNQVKYTHADVAALLDLVSKGYSMEDIGYRLNKSALGIRGKLERMGYKFRNGVPYKLDGEAEVNANEKQTNEQSVCTS
ncbi:SANT/Myb-like DNA-binding domain-containing protein [Sporosarcina sp. P33]|uniref:SANT/Myb-like DNA-binding domain-containing protein n=1 Tax=Sporosarcina sp. P33 TaxID=1930764 RepID=UPI0009BE15C4|nr:SANT/Myb-like DNA-binding domain-containing protein [Sporosarcina sp. P33]ARD47595.1 hypothetical protein SporoP33_04645 [Sporosarcina sp. P33]